VENRAVYNVREIAKLLNINVPRAYELAKQKDFPAIRIGKRIVVPKQAFERWLELQAWKKEED
jgi:excisionase family DNA binding protein